MGTNDYVPDLRDIRFVLFEQLKIQDQLKSVDRYADFDTSTYEAMLDAAAGVAQTLAACNQKGDRVGCKLDKDGNITTPPGFKEGYKAMAESGLLGAALGPEWGGLGMPHAIDAAMVEVLSGANTAFNIYTGLTRAAANLLVTHFCPEWLKGIVLPKMVSGEWAGTMCLTEAGAGSSVGDNRCRALRTDEAGVYHLTGEKIFISGGDNDFSQNILHLVLARTPDAPNGTRGISIFLVPKFLFDKEGNLIGRNDAKVVGIEHKMGINGSATSTLSLGSNDTCVGWLLGKEREGMKIMFHMMNEARIGVGIQALGLASASYQNALAYAKYRVQGTSVENFANDDAPRVTINQHPDVRRMLMFQKAHVETMRSLCYSTANRFDRATFGAEDERDYLLGLVELMTPIVKSHCSDVGFEVCCQALQVFGGYGYTQEYPVEQHVRDSKISSIYEGTNGIQAMDLLGRKMRKGGGALFMNWLNEANTEIENVRELKVFNDEIGALEKARDQLGGTAMHLGALGMAGNIKGAMLQSSPFLTLFGTVVLGLHAAWQARIAWAAIQNGADGEDLAFYKGKVAIFKYYSKNILPRATALAKGIQAGDESCLEDGLFD